MQNATKPPSHDDDREIGVKVYSEVGRYIGHRIALLPPFCMYKEDESRPGGRERLTTGKTLKGLFLQVLT